ncbi:protein shisa-5-like [Anneissia japonica]|uniref:protein shisa-5-like n=1 Tax=Anneissia japonica TaxID=1529436 RepID=UPI001425B5C2|nr:protein shisa-5-like [Anneissia japonica]
MDVSLEHYLVTIFCLLCFGINSGYTFDCIDYYGNVEKTCPDYYDGVYRNRYDLYCCGSSGSFNCCKFDDYYGTGSSDDSDNDIPDGISTAIIVVIVISILIVLGIVGGIIACCVCGGCCCAQKTKTTRPVTTFVVTQQTKPAPAVVQPSHFTPPVSNPLQQQVYPHPSGPHPPPSGVASTSCSRTKIIKLR